MISVIIPAYNAANFIQRTIDSVLAQTYKDFELIIVDDGSNDNTANVAKSYGDKLRYIYQSNAGDGPARNTGIKAAKSEWIAFLDHDDEWLPEKLQVEFDLLRNNPNLKWCAASFYQSHSGKQKQVGNSPEIVKALRSKQYFDNYFDAARIPGIQIMTSTMVMHKSLFDEMGLLDSCFMRHADLDMWWRIAHKYPQIGYIPQALSIMHLDVQTGLNTLLVLKDKRGRDARVLVSRHLKLAEEFGDIDHFRPYAGMFMTNILRTTLYHGFGEDATDIINEFGDLFSARISKIALFLARFPRITSVLMRSVSYLKFKMGLADQITRRYSQKQVMLAQSHAEVVAASKPT